MNTKNLVVAKRLLYSIFFISFISYLSTLQYRPYPYYHFVKIIPIISLLFIALLNIPGSRGKLIVSGLFFSAIGDVFLSASGKGFFIYGLSAFGLAHIMYIFALLKLPEWKRRRTFFSMVFVLYGLFIGFWLFPNIIDNGRFFPIGVYFFLLMFMGISAVLGRNNHFLIIPGAFLFMISDSIIAVNMFISKIPNSSFWIMLTYYPAQFLITYGASLKCEKES
jgi:alkenylglycerophosphocholine hydrolase